LLGSIDYGLARITPGNLTGAEPGTADDNDNNALSVAVEGDPFSKRARGSLDMQRANIPFFSARSQ